MSCCASIFPCCRSRSASNDITRVPDKRETKSAVPVQDTQPGAAPAVKTGGLTKSGKPAPAHHHLMSAQQKAGIVHRRPTGGSATDLYDSVDGGDGEEDGEGDDDTASGKSSGTAPDNPRDSDIQDSPPISRPSGRRKSVFAEHYNPEEDDDEAAKLVYPKTDEQRLQLSEAVRLIFLFRSLDQEQMQDVIDAMFERKVTTGEYVIVQGDDGDNFYVIHSGTYEIYVSCEEGKKLVGKYENRGSFGELALMYNMPRAATIQAMTEGSLWAMDRQTFRRIILKNAFRKRRMYEALLENVPMLKQLEAYERMNLADALYPRSFEDGQEIIKQGDKADGMYFVEDGTVVISIVTDDDANAREVKRINKGGYLGELALVTHKPRAASAYAVGKVKLAFLDVQAFERLLGPCMDIMKRNINDYEEQLIKLFGDKKKKTST